MTSVNGGHTASLEALEASQARLQAMKSICEELSKANKQLRDRVYELEQELDTNNDPSKEIIDIEKKLSQYRLSLSKYHMETNHKLSQKDLRIKKLSLQNENLYAKLKEEQNYSVELEEKLNQFQNLKRSESRQKKKTSFGNSSRRLQTLDTESTFITFNSQLTVTVQQQLEKLIQKLMKELDYERKARNKLSEELRQTQEDLNKAQKQIKSKNKCIYDLQIRSIQVTRAQNIDESFRLNQSKFRDSKVTSSEKSLFLQINHINTKSQSLTDFLEKGESTAYERLIVASKIIEFFMKRLSIKDHQAICMDSLVISSKQEMLSISILPSYQLNASPEESSQESLLDSLGYILDSVLRHPCPNEKEQIGRNPVEAQILNGLSKLQGGTNRESIGKLLSKLKEKVDNAATMRAP